MAQLNRRDSRNFGYGRQLNYAGLQALRDSYGQGRFATVQAHGERWRLFAKWCRQQHNLNDARRIDRQLLQDYAHYLSQAVGQGEMAISTAQNRLSTVNRTLEVLRGDRQVRLSSPSQTLGLYRSNARTEAPHGQDRSQLTGLSRALQYQGYERVAAILGLARNCGMRLRKTILADLPRLQREAAQHGAINIAEGTKGGRRGASAPRWIPATPELRLALAQASAVSPKGSRNLLDGQERYVTFINRQIRPARELLHAHGKGFHELRTAYACERFQQITGHSAPVNGGRLHRLDRNRDRQAREVLSKELGHNRIEVVSAYIGARR